MILELIFLPFITLVKFVITLLPTIETPSVALNTVIDLAGYGVTILGSSFTVLVLGNIVMWLTIQFTWSIIEWIYKKIPGVE